MGASARFQRQGPREPGGCWRPWREPGVFAELLLCFSEPGGHSRRPWAAPSRPCENVRPLPPDGGARRCPYPAAQASFAGVFVL